MCSAPKRHQISYESDYITQIFLVAGIKKITPRTRMLRVHNDPKSCIFDWNDARGRQEKDVKKAFRAAIRIGNDLRPAKA